MQLAFGNCKGSKYTHPVFTPVAFILQWDLNAVNAWSNVIDTNQAIISSYLNPQLITFLPTTKNLLH